MAYADGLTAPQFTLSGKVTDNGLITNVVIFRTYPEGGSNITAVVSQTAPGKLTYTNAPLTLVDGTNIFTITATDSAGNAGVYTEKIFFVNRDTRLTVESCRQRQREWDDHSARFRPTLVRRWTRRCWRLGIITRSRR